jgi:hypothetical protein
MAKRAVARTLHQKRVEAIEQARYQLPVAYYLEIVHNAATKGVVPKMDDEGRPTGEYSPIDGKEQLRQCQYMIDKVMPTKLPTADQLGPEPNSEPEKLTPADTRHMAHDELLAIVEGVFTVDDFEDA